jgi:hypothetical protein
MTVYFSAQGVRTPARPQARRRTLPTVKVERLADATNDKPLNLPEVAAVDALADARDVRGLLKVHADIIGELTACTFSADDAVRACDVLEHVQAAIHGLDAEQAVALADRPRGPQSGRTAPQRPLADRVADARESLRPSGPSSPAVKAQASELLKAMRGK